MDVVKGGGQLGIDRREDRQCHQPSGCLTGLSRVTNMKGPTLPAVQSAIATILILTWQVVVNPSSREIRMYVWQNMF